MEQCFLAHQDAEPINHEPCDNCCIIKDLLKFKQQMYVSSFTFACQPSEIFRRTIDALDNDYRSDLIEVSLTYAANEFTLILSRDFGSCLYHQQRLFIDFIF
jgi:hypothetical protein